MPPIEISLTTLMDFVGKTGPPRVTCVREAHARYATDYHPMMDFWRPLREAVAIAHQSGGTLATLDTLPGRVSERKREHYRNGVEGYRKFIRNRQIGWFQAASSLWSAHGLSVKINPELGLVIDGRAHHVKLYLRKEPLQRPAAQSILYLLGQLPAGEHDATPLVLDVLRAKSFEPNRRTERMGPLLEGEAAAFVAMWHGVDQAA